MWFFLSDGLVSLVYYFSTGLNALINIQASDEYSCFRVCAFCIVLLCLFFGFLWVFLYKEWPLPFYNCYFVVCKFVY